ncbi:hypothetical protein [Hymenobacter persicinus]|uniref:Uncharacterized protein n=1 Tax=Hymenobacter persicinus TaxID=2025506 RepID=A0A4Q5L614_9BACT|nr:hypothetical protein [Hymenobacter persicinus]RYU72685.1 hypothetical protein EWM57_20855 [Hymenobacter persicinus]RYU80715.1 hypothetical protein EWM57_07630 [Hymenobacter persicinus]
MTKRILALLFLSLSSTPLFAQQESLESLTRKQGLRNQYLHNDTAQAIINLYGRRQGGGVSWIVGSALAAARIATAPSNNQVVGGGYVVQENTNNGALAFVFAAPFAAYGAGKLLHYSNGKLEMVLTNYAAGKPLARSLRRKLKPRFFNQPIIDYKPVEAVPAK